MNSLRGADKKRGRSENDNPSRKKSRIALDASDATRHSSTVPSPLLTSSSVSSPDSPGSPRLPFEPLSLQGVSRDNSFDSQLDASQGTKSTVFSSDPSFESFSHCGLCDETVLVCVCREVDMHELGTTLPTMSVSKSESTKSILDDLPKYQPPLPLRRRRRRRSTNVNRTPVFPIFNQSSDSSPVCTGDPQNCQACAADDFGKAFCIAVNQSAAAACENCPATSSSSSRAGDGCCGKGIQCWKIRAPSPASGSASPSANLASSSSDMISCDSAWRQFKSHPNVESSDLSLLAEVVARRSKCTGPQVVVSPAPGFITPERTSTPTSLSPLESARENKAEGSAKHSDGSHHSGTSFPAKLVPQEVLARCGREQRVRTVHVDAVQAALRLLDAKSTFYKM